MSLVESDKATPAPGKLPASSLVSRLVVIGVIVFGVAFLFAYAAGWLTPRALTPTRIADRFEALNGVHPGFRRNHAKGVCVSGYFESNGKGAALCKSLIFQMGRVPVVGRFSLGGGLPYAADSAQNVRGLGILFQLPNGDD
jgi:catalase